MAKIIKLIGLISLALAEVILLYFAFELNIGKLSFLLIALIPPLIALALIYPEGIFPKILGVAMTSLSSVGILLTVFLWIPNIGPKSDYDFFYFIEFMFAFMILVIEILLLTLGIFIINKAWEKFSENKLNFYALKKFGRRHQVLNTV